MLMKYLIDSLHSYERGYSDALCPSSKNDSATYLGQGELVAPITKADIPLLAKSVVNAVSLSNIHAPSYEGPMVSRPNTGPGYYSTNAPASLSNMQDASDGTIQPVMNTAWPQLEYGMNNSEHPEHPVKKKCTSIYTSEPLPGIYIPNLKRGRGAWHEAVKQWEVGDPQNGVIPLAQWPKEWYTVDMHPRTAAKRNNRQRIWEEYER